MLEYKMCLESCDSNSFMDKINFELHLYRKNKVERTEKLL